MSMAHRRSKHHVSKWVSALILVSAMGLPRITVAVPPLSYGQPVRLAGAKGVDLQTPPRMAIRLSEGTTSSDPPKASKHAPATQLEPDPAARAHPPFRLQKTHCGNRGCRPRSPWWLELSNPIDPTTLTDRSIIVRPAVAGLEVDVDSNWLVLLGRVTGPREFQITIDADLKDIFGQSLTPPNEATIHVRSADGGSTPYWPHTIVLDPSGQRAVAIEVQAQESIHIQVWRVQPSDWPAYLAYRHSASKLSPPGKLVVDRRLTLQNPMEEPLETLIDLTPALDAELGHAILQVQSSRLYESPRRGYSRLLTWAQSTHIGLSVFVDTEKMAIWTTDLGTGQRRAGVELTSEPAQTTAISDGNGIAWLHLPPKQSHPTAASAYLVARSGRDIAILPEPTRPKDSIGHWWANPPKMRDACYVLTDWPYCRFGDTVHIKGWIRAIEGGPQGGLVDLTRLRRSVREVRYQIGDGGTAMSTISGTAPLNRLGGFDFSFKMPQNIGPKSVRLDIEGPHSQCKINLPLQATPADLKIVTTSDETVQLVGEPTRVTTQIRDSDGNLQSERPVQWNVTVSESDFPAPNHSEYVFGRWRTWPTSALPRNSDSRQKPQRRHFRGQTDINGQHTLRVDIDRVKPPRVLEVFATAQVVDSNGRSWTDAARFRVLPARLAVGLHSKNAFVYRGMPIEVEAVVVRPDGSRVAGQPIDIEVERLVWRRIHDRESTQWGYAVAERQASRATSMDLPVTYMFVPQSTGLYRVIAQVIDKDGRSQKSEVLVWVSDSSLPGTTITRPVQVVLIPDKSEYAPFQVARILVLAPFADGEGTVSLRRDGLLSIERFTMRGVTHTLKIPIHAQHVPNLRVHVELVGSVRRHRSDSGTMKLPSRPTHAVGTFDLPISLDRHRLLVTVKRRDPHEIEIRVQDSQGKAVPSAEIAMAIIPSGLGDIGHRTLPDPLETFFPPRAAGTRDQRNREVLIPAGPAHFETAIDVGDTPLTPEELARFDRRTRRGPQIGQVFIPTLPPRFSRSPSETALRGPQKPETRVFIPGVLTDHEGRAQARIGPPGGIANHRVLIIAVSSRQRFGYAELLIPQNGPPQRSIGF